VIAGSDRGQSHAKQFLGQLWRDSKPSRHIFAISHDDVDLALGDKARHHSRHGTSSRLSHDIPDEQHFHLAYSM
jgi:hypothetical protein